MTSANKPIRAARYGMTIDLDRCNGCGACMVACAVENNMPPAHEGATDRKGITWIRVYKMDNGEEYPGSPVRLRARALPAMRRRNALRARLPPAGGGGGPGHRHRGPDARALPGLPLLHGRVPVPRALLQLVGPGQWPAGMEKTLNPDVAPRMRGVVEKCNFCHGRWHAAKERAAAAGKPRDRAGRLRSGLRGSVPRRRHPLRRFEGPGQRTRASGRRRDSFRLLEKIGTEPEDLLPLPDATGCGSMAAAPQASQSERSTARG